MFSEIDGESKDKTHAKQIDALGSPDTRWAW
jgi:hypothetical protein